jgi:hypothetical protein
VCGFGHRDQAAVGNGPLAAYADSVSAGGDALERVVDGCPARRGARRRHRGQAQVLGGVVPDRAVVGSPTVGLTVLRLESGRTLDPGELGAKLGLELVDLRPGQSGCVRCLLHFLLLSGNRSGSGFFQLHSSILVLPSSPLDARRPTRLGGAGGA